MICAQWKKQAARDGEVAHRTALPDACADGRTSQNICESVGGKVSRDALVPAASLPKLRDDIFLPSRKKTRDRCAGVTTTWTTGREGRS